MFFDDKTEDLEYQKLLLDIAKTQQQLFAMRFDMEEKEPFPWPSDKRAAHRYDELVRELSRMKEQTAAHRKRQGYSGGIFWWNMDWENVQHYLMCDLWEEKLDGSWRFDHQWKAEQNHGATVLFLQESGHYSDFSTSTTTTYAKESVYSESQQSAMVDAYRQAQRDSDARRILLSSDKTMVYSYRSDTLYASDADYVMSAEHWFYQKNAREKFERSLYTEHITNHATAVSNSRHYECLFAVAAFHIDGSGILDTVKPLDYQLCAKTGAVPENVQEPYREKDAAVGAAAYLAARSDITKVPVSLFGRDITTPAPNYSEAMRQAELYTCLAQKLWFAN